MICDVCGSENTMDKRFDKHTIRVCRDCHSGIDICERLGIMELTDF